MASEITTTKNCISLVYVCLGMRLPDYSVAELAMLCEEKSRRSYTFGRCDWAGKEQIGRRLLGESV